MNAGEVRDTQHWRVWQVDDPSHDLHLLFTLLAGDRATGGTLMEDERNDLDAAVSREVHDRRLMAYKVLVHVTAGQPMEVHLLADGPGVQEAAGDQPAEGADMRFVLDLAQATKCPLCGHEVARWEIDTGTRGHDPGE